MSSPRDDDAANRATVPPPHSGNSSVDFEHLVPALRAPVSVPLGRLEMTVFTRIDGRRSVNDIASEIGLTPFEVLRILERLMQLVPDLTVGQQEVVELSVDELWDEDEAIEATTAEVPVKPR
ncbi:MAG: hypothetical protein HYV09_17070 [Deltaproteobacteria bacterium]|nr:hypothetical protein [Deltaproteobacteria bacterium]